MTVEELIKTKYFNIAEDGKTASMKQRIEKLEKRVLDLEKLVENLINEK